MLRQKGQAIVEFAITFPLFFFIFLSIIYGSLTMLDYLTVTEIARGSAQAAAMKKPSEYSTVKAKFAQQYADQGWFKNGLYAWDPEKESDFSITVEDEGVIENTVVSEITMRRNDGFSTIRMLDYVFNLPEKISVKYRFYSDKTKDT